MAAAGEPRPEFAEGVAMKERYRAKAMELGVGVRTIERCAADYRDGGEAALVDDRRRSSRSDTVDPRWDAAVRAELTARVKASTPITGIAVQRLRRTRTLLALLRDLLDNPDGFYGLQVHQRTCINEGTLYPMLHRIHSAGWLTSRPEDNQSWLAGAPPGRGPGRRRTYYTLTTEGHRAAHHELNQPRRKRKTDETTHAQNP